MAEKKKRRVVKPSTTMREQLEKSEEPKKRSLSKTVKKAGSSRLGKAKSFGQREYHPIKLPDNKAGKILGKRVSIMPRYFREAWQELRQVTWPNRRETFKLTTAVLIFAITFGSLVAIVDLVLDKIFRNVILK